MATGEHAIQTSFQVRIQESHLAARKVAKLVQFSHKAASSLAKLPRVAVGKTILIPTDLTRGEGIDCVQAGSPYLLQFLVRIKQICKSMNNSLNKIADQDIFVITLNLMR